MTKPPDDLKTTTAKTEELQTLAADLNREHQLAQEHAHQAVAHALNAGDMLLQAKANIRHGHFADWLDENFAGSARTAQRYMRLAKHRPELEAKAPSMADLTLGAAEAALATPKDERRQPEKVVDQNEQPPSPKAETASPTADEYLRFRHRELEKSLEKAEASKQALREIRDRHLYRATHATFRAYCRERWLLSDDTLALLDA